MSSVLKALKKLEKDPNREAATGALWQWKTEPQKPIAAKRIPGRHPRIVALGVIFVTILAVGGWLFLTYAPLSTGKSQPVKSVQDSREASATKTPANRTPSPKKSDSKPKADRSSLPAAAVMKERTPARKTVAVSQPDARVLEKQEGKPPAAVTGSQAKTQSVPLKLQPQVDSDSLQPDRYPIRASGSPSQEDALVLKNNISYPPRTTVNPEVIERTVLTGFSVQAIAWSKIPAERIAVINGVVLREGGFIEGMQVVQIDLDQVYLKKDEKVWLLQCGR